MASRPAPDGFPALRRRIGWPSNSILVTTYALNPSQSGIYIDTGLGSAECTFLDTGLRRCDEECCSFRLRALTHCRLPKQTLGFNWM